MSKATILNKLLKFKTLLYLFALAGMFSFGYVSGYSGYQVRYDNEIKKISISREIPDGKEDVSFDLFWRVWDELEGKYYDKGKINEESLVYGAIQGMVSAVGDPYTIFLPPSQNSVIQEDLQGSFEGVGIQIGFRKTQLTVIAPLPGSPAEKAGVKPGDSIIGIIDESKKIDTSTSGMTLPEAVNIIRGEAGTSVRLALLRENLDEPLFLDIVRQSIDVPSVTLSYIDSDGVVTEEPSDVAYIQLYKFAGETMVEWEKVVLDIVKDENIEGIILDLRNNPGGYLNTAVELASEFVEMDKVVVKEDSGSEMDEEYKVQRIGRLRNKDLVVLINKGSASSSEILAGALRDIKSVKLVGETSFGKGTIQQPDEIEDGSGLHITIAKWLTPNGTWVHDVGLKPDYEVEDDEETEIDEQVLKAYQVLQSK